MKRISILAVAMLAFTAVWGQSKVSPFTAHYLRGQQAQTRTMPVSEEVVSAYLHTVGTPDVSALEALGVSVNLQLDGILTVRLPLSAVPALEQLDFVKYIQLGTPVRPMLDKARPAAGVDKIHAGEGLQLPYTGKGVVVGIIDGGFDYTHPAFYDEATGALRIKRVWEQGADQGTAPSGFGYGIELATEADIIAAGGDVATQSHGNHVAAIAAGSYRVADNPYCGIAPDADIVLVSKGEITANSANISDAIAYIYNYAESVGKPCVVNMSLGWHQGPHDGSSPFDQVADQLQGTGRVLVGSMGNYGNDRVHVSKTFTNPSSSTESLRAMVEYKITPSKSNVGGEIDIWGDEGMSFDLKVAVVKKDDGSEADAMKTMDVSLAEGATEEHSFSSRYASGTVIVTTEVNPINGKPHAFVTLNLESLRAMSYAVGIVITPRTAGTVHAWADATFTQFAEEVPAGWQAGDKEHTLCEIGGTGKKIISVGAYVSSNTYTEWGSSQQKMTEETLGALATFSSVGPTIDGRVKPDIVAPGTFIASAVNSFDSYKSAYPTASAVVWNDKTYNYSYMQGTSMAAPFVTGVIATWLQACPELDSDAIREVLAKTAVNDKHTQQATCGYGKIDAYNGLKEVLARVSSVDVAEVGTPACILSRQSDGNYQLFFTAQQMDVEIVLSDAAGNLVNRQSYPLMEQGGAVNLSMAGLPRGIYLLRVGKEVYKIIR